MRRLVIWCEECGERPAKHNPLGEALVCGHCFRQTERTAVPQPWAEFPKSRRRLAKSLACYVSEDDWGLDRRSFLETVSSRIADDLRDGTQ